MNLTKERSAAAKAAKMTGQPELLDKDQMGAPAQQTTLDGKKVLKITPPAEVRQAAEYWLEKKVEETVAKNNVGKAVEDLLSAMKKHKMTQLTVHDDMKQPWTLLIIEQEKIKKQKATEGVGVDAGK